jgi:hypothetical protein
MSACYEVSALRITSSHSAALEFDNRQDIPFLGNSASRDECGGLSGNVSLSRSLAGLQVPTAPAGVPQSASS